VLGRLAASVITLGGMAFLGGQTARGFIEYRALTAVALAKGEVDDRGKAQLIAALKMAHEAEPKNPETAYEIGEAFRLLSWGGSPGYQELALEAMKWFRVAIELNPYDGYSYMRYGMCLHWLGRSAEAAPFFEKARALDPRGYYMASHQGWHFFQLADYVEAKRWFELAMQLSAWRLDHRAPDPIATSYLKIVDRKLAETVPLPVPVQAP
jgi:tetratricopeptide (TPR) repeat protein